MRTRNFVSTTEDYRLVPRIAVRLWGTGMSDGRGLCLLANDGGVWLYRDRKVLPVGSAKPPAVGVASVGLSSASLQLRFDRPPVPIVGRECTSPSLFNAWRDSDNSENQCDPTPNG
jgi:hypothetical protein